MSRGFRRSHLILIVIVLLALVVRMYAFVAAAPWDSTVQNTIILQKDAYEYHDLAREILHGHSFGNTLRMPGYPAFIALVYGIFGERPEVVLFIQLILSVLTLALIYGISLSLFSKPVALIGAFLYAMDPLPVFYSLNLLSETLFTLVFLLALAALVHGIRKGRAMLELSAGLLLGMSILIRPIAQYLPIVIAVLIIGFNTRETLARRVKTSLLIAMGTLVVISPWLLRNYLLYDACALTTQKGDGLLLYNAALTESYKSKRPYETVRQEFAEIADSRYKASGITNPFIKNRIQIDYATEYIRNNVFSYGIVHLRGMVNTFISPDTRRICALYGIRHFAFPDGFVAVSSLREKVSAFFTYKPLFEVLLGLYIIFLSVFAYFFAVVGFVKYYHRGDIFLWLLFLSIILYFSVLTGPFGYSRYRVPVIPVYTIIAAYGLSHASLRLSRYAKGHRKPRMMLSRDPENP